MALARSIASGHGLTVPYLWAFVDVGGVVPAAATLPIEAGGHWMPLAALVQVPFIALLGPTDMASALPFLLAGALLAPLTLLLGRDLGFGERASRLAALLMVVPGGCRPISANRIGVWLTLTAGLASIAERDDDGDMPRVPRAHRFELDLTADQRKQVEQFARGRRDAWNWALALDRELYAADLPPADWSEPPSGWNVRRRMSPFEMNLAWPRVWRAVMPRHACPGQPAQLAFSDMDKARDAAVARRRGFPRLRSRYDPHQTVAFMQGVSLVGDAIKVPGIKAPLRVRGSTRRLHWFLENATGTIQKTTISRDSVHGPWGISIVIEHDIPDILAPDDRPVVGLDLGITHFLTLSDGTVIENPRVLDQALARLRRAQQAASRSEEDRKHREAASRAAGTLGSRERLPKSSRHVAKDAVVARLYARVRNLRSEFHHTTANLLLSRYRAIGIEDLNVAGMLRNRRLARHIADAGWASFLSILRYKADAAGVEIVVAGRWFASSQRCSACGAVNKAVKDLSVREWACPGCGSIHDRDINAATNLRPDETRLLAARAMRLAEREKAAAARQKHKEQAAKAAETKKANAAKRAERERVAARERHTERSARHADRKSARPTSTEAVTPTATARRGPVRPRGATTVVPSAVERQAPRGVARTSEARTNTGDRRRVSVGAIVGASLSPPVSPGV